MARVKPELGCVIDGRVVKLRQPRALPTAGVAFGTLTARFGVRADGFR